MSANIQIQQTTSMPSPITCHVLDSSRGIPASGVRVQLELKSPPETNSKTEDTWGFIAEGYFYINRAANRKCYYPN